MENSKELWQRSKPFETLQFKPLHRLRGISHEAAIRGERRVVPASRHYPGNKGGNVEL